MKKTKEMLPIKKWQSLKDILKERPSIEGQTNNNTIKFLGLDSKRFLEDAELFIKAQLLLSAYYKFDKPCIDYDFYSTEAESLGQEVIYRSGYLPEINIQNPLLEEKKKLYSLKLDISKNNERFGFVTTLNDLFKSFIGYAPRIRFCGPFSLAVSLRGYRNLMIDMQDDKKYVQELFEFLTDEVIIPWIKLQREELNEPNAMAGGQNQLQHCQMSLWGCLTNG